jgi:hypothetical protein
MSNGNTPRRNWRAAGKIGLPIVAVILVASGWYVVTKPCRDSQVVLEQIQQVQVGKTSMEGLKQIIAQRGFPGNAKILCFPDDCTYTFLAMNKTLHFLHLAPHSYLLTNIVVRNGVVTAIVLNSASGDYGNLASLNFVQSFSDSPEYYPFRCGQERCIKRLNATDGSPWRIYVALLPSVPVAERNRLLSLNTSCLSRIGGCKNARDLLPTIENN